MGLAVVARIVSVRSCVCSFPQRDLSCAQRRSPCHRRRRHVWHPCPRASTGRTGSMKLTVVRPLLIDVYINGRNRNPPVLAWAAPQKSRSSAGPILLMQLWREIVRRATGKDGPCGTHLWPLATFGQTMLSWRCAAILIIDEPYKRGGRPFAAKQESREPRAAAVFNTMCGGRTRDEGGCR